jgi:hypothetical protein
MHFGIFVEEMRRGVDQAGAFREAFAVAERADAWGADCGGSVRSTSRPRAR